MGAPYQISADFRLRVPVVALQKLRRALGAHLLLSCTLSAKTLFSVPALCQFSSKSSLASHSSALKPVRSESKPAFSGRGLQRRRKVTVKAAYTHDASYFLPFASRYCVTELKLKEREAKKQIDPAQKRNLEESLSRILSV
ncbi:hypothetical protein QQF64_003892 [Cirrhinus molitorella]|uniref:Uncharacterized protein n=1 Tax=Cirrhinus molitorella TaxID=172907 RepID=A0ABR3MMK8_9TELE